MWRPTLQSRKSSTPRTTSLISLNNGKIMGELRLQADNNDPRNSPLSRTELRAAPMHPRSFKGPGGIVLFTTSDCRLQICRPNILTDSGIESIDQSAIATVGLALSSNARF